MSRSADQSARALAFQLSRLVSVIGNEYDPGVVAAACHVLGALDSALGIGLESDLERLRAMARLAGMESEQHFSVKEGK